jgi:3-oxoacyl-(acyl-carrier-protein) synthase
MPGLDRMETRVLKEVLGGHASSVPVSAIKSMVGETFSASGALALAAAVGAIRNGFIPPTMNYLLPDPQCDLDCVPNSARQRQVNRVLMTAADPYGQNAAVILGGKGR